MVFVVLILLGFIGFIGYAYYLDHKADPKEFMASLSKLKAGLAALVGSTLLVGLINEMTDMIFPIRMNHGIEFNAQRAEHELPPINPNWYVNDFSSSQYKKEWRNPNKNAVHLKKILLYNYYSLYKEEDYYRETNGDLLIQKFNYLTHSKKFYRNYLKLKTSPFHPNYTEVEEISEEEFKQSLQKVKQPIVKSSP